MRQVAKPDEQLLEKLNIDTRYVYVKSPASRECSECFPETYVDEWGTRFRKSGYYYEPIEFPLQKANLAQIRAYQVPDPHLPERFRGLEEEVLYLHEKTKYAIVAGFTRPLFEQAWFLRGFEQFLQDIVLDFEIAEALLEKVLEFNIQVSSHFLKLAGKYIDIALIVSDFDTQDGMLISTRLWRKLFKPFLKELIACIKRHTEAKVALHCCGSIFPIIPDLIEIGVDILNPIQPGAKDMEPQRLKKMYGDELTFWGGIDVQRILPFGSPEDVENEVKNKIKALAPGGGYILSPSHNIQPDTSVENILAMYEASRKFGRYPVNG